MVLEQHDYSGLDGTSSAPGTYFLAAGQAQQSIDNTNGIPASSHPVSLPEPYVDADVVAQYLSVPRREVLKLTRKGVITGYPISGRYRHVYKYKLSEVDRDIAKLRKPSTMALGSPRRFVAKKEKHNG